MELLTSLHSTNDAYRLEYCFSDRLLEMLYCEICGTTLFGGSRFTLPANQGWELLTADADIEGIPDRHAARFVERRTYREFAVFWPSGGIDLSSEAERWRQPGIAVSGEEGRWMPATLDPNTGRVRQGTAGSNSGLISGIYLCHSESY